MLRVDTGRRWQGHPATTGWLATHYAHEPRPAQGANVRKRDFLTSVKPAGRPPHGRHQQAERRIAPAAPAIDASRRTRQ